MQVDARNMTCPKPVILVLEALPKLGRGESLEVLVDNETAVGNVTRLAAEKGCALATEARDGYISLVLTPSGVIAPEADASAAGSAFCDLPATPSSVIAVGSDSMGRGSDELGKILVKGLIYALAHQEVVPSVMLFFNSGAHLTCEGSESLDDIRELASRGTEVRTCGTCLDFYGMRDKLAVGTVTNLYAIAETIASQPGVFSI